jgi:hypothetical protein
MRTLESYPTIEETFIKQTVVDGKICVVNLQDTAWQRISISSSHLRAFNFSIHVRQRTGLQESIVTGRRNA